MQMKRCDPRCGVMELDTAPVQLMILCKAQKTEREPVLRNRPKPNRQRASSITLADPVATPRLASRTSPRGPRVV
jgi:hypothetical protein